ncbi:MAG TPA: alpha/beta fold hydrolase, partial [Candidatus Limnocylindrales bacterium]|nr:alpha/beta fold hydrolase [Candidatus Limnocylindrales bacterium]
GVTRRITAPDGVEIAVFRTGTGAPLVLVHGATADHTAWRTAGPLFATRHAVAAIDRRGHGESGDTPTERRGRANASDPDRGYSIEREFDDLAAVVDTIAAEVGRPVDVVGHSYGGRIALGAALRTSNLRRLVTYEGAPPAPEGPRYQDADATTLGHVESLVAAGRRDEALETFLREIVGMPEADLAAYRANPIWPRRVAAVHTAVRELRAEDSPAASLDALARVRGPVLQVLGGDSPPAFVAATRALDARLRNGRVVTISGARHAAHHSHPEAFVSAVEAFLADPEMADSAP